MRWLVAFFFEPKKATNKVRDDTVHFHRRVRTRTARENGRWKFTRWDLVDLSHFKVKLKAEFQGSNYEMYRADAIVASGKDD